MMSITPWQGAKVQTSAEVRHSGFDPWVEIKPEHLRQNVNTVSKSVGNRPILAVIKNNGYGLGVVPIAQALAPLPQVRGLAVIRLQEAFAIRDAGITVSLFLDANEQQIRAAADLGANAVELHTGQYALAKGHSVAAELFKLRGAGKLVRELGLTLHAGHGLTYRNVIPVAQIDGMDELNIGHSIVSRAVMVGMEAAVREMKRLID